MDTHVFPMLFFLVLGLHFLYVGVRTHKIGYWLYHEGTRTFGIMRRIIRKGSGKNVTYYPVIEFDSEDKVHIIKQLTIGTSWGHWFKRGQTVTVVYDPDNPEDCEIKSRLRLVTIPFIHCGIGLVFAGAAVYHLICLINNQ